MPTAVRLDRQPCTLAGSRPNPLSSIARNLLRMKHRLAMCAPHGPGRDLSTASTVLLLRLERMKSWEGE